MNADAFIALVFRLSGIFFFLVFGIHLLVNW